jgi:hypothetical protein
MVLPSGDWQSRSHEPFATRVVGSFARLYQGKKSVASAFWGYYLLLGVALRAGTGFLINLGGRTPQAFSLGIALWLAYMVFATIGVWRCANAKSPVGFWAGFAKFATVLFDLGALSQAIKLYASMTS